MGLVAGPIIRAPTLVGVLVVAPVVAVAGAAVPQVRLGALVVHRGKVGSPSGRSATNTRQCRLPTLLVACGYPTVKAQQSDWRGVLLCLILRKKSMPRLLHWCRLCLTWVKW